MALLDLFCYVRARAYRILQTADVLEFLFNSISVLCRQLNTLFTLRAQFIHKTVSRKYPRLSNVNIWFYPHFTLLKRSVFVLTRSKRIPASWSLTISWPCSSYCWLGLRTTIVWHRSSFSSMTSPISSSKVESAWSTQSRIRQHQMCLYCSVWVGFLYAW